MNKKLEALGISYQMSFDIKKEWTEIYAKHELYRTLAKCNPYDLNVISNPPLERKRSKRLKQCSTSEVEFALIYQKRILYFWSNTILR
jgi:hypothetical protein